MKIVNAYFPYQGRFVKGAIEVSEDKISRVSSDIEEVLGNSDLDAGGQIVLPGFIDMHIHGWGGFDTMDGKTESVLKLAQQLAQFGVTSFLPTTFTHAPETTLQALSAVQAAQTQVQTGAQILGVHLEGPYISSAAKGAQPEKYIRVADPNEYEKWFETGLVREVTVAPEIKENHVFIQECVKRGIVVSIGHSNAEYEDVQQAVKLGATQVTHTFNGMKALHHRDPGTVGGALTEDALSCEVIADLLHLHPATIKLIVRAKGVDKVILVTDAVGPAGLPEGEYLVLDDKARIVRDGRIVNSAGSLSGSSLSLDQALRNVIQATGMKLEEIWPLTSRNAARQLKVRKGEIKVGYDADFVVLNEKLEVQKTFSLGKEIFSRS